MTGFMRVGVFVEMPNILQRMRCDSDPIESAGLSQRSLENPDYLLRANQIGKLFQESVRATRCEAFGVLLGQTATLNTLGVIGRYMRTAPTLGHAILAFCENQKRYARGIFTSLVIENDVAYWQFGTYDFSEAGAELSDAAMAMATKYLAELVGAAPDEVLLPRRRPDNVAAYHQAFHCPVRFEANQCALAFSPALLGRRLPSADPDIHQSLGALVSAYRVVPEPGFEERVRRLIHRSLLSHTLSADAIAAELGMHPRTVHRKLESKGVNFRELVAQARFYAATELLTKTHIEISEISDALGYADPSGFSRAYRAWSGATPRDLRSRATATFN